MRIENSLSRWNHQTSRIKRMYHYILLLLQVDHQRISMHIENSLSRWNHQTSRIKRMFHYILLLLQVKSYVGAPFTLLFHIEV
jgi:hypothetical protein